MRRTFLNPQPACECAPTKCDHSFYWPTEGILEHRPQTVVTVEMPDWQPCPAGLVEVVSQPDPEPAKSTRKRDVPSTTTDEGAAPAPVEE